MRRTSTLVIPFIVVAAVAALVGPAHAGKTATARKKCAPIPGPAYKGSKKWNLGVTKVTCAAGELAARPILPIAAKARARKTVKNGSFTCMVYPGGAECTGKGGQAFGVASTAFGSG